MYPRAQQAPEPHLVASTHGVVTTTVRAEPVTIVTAALLGLLHVPVSFVHQVAARSPTARPPERRALHPCGAVIRVTARTSTAITMVSAANADLSPGPRPLPVMRCDAQSEFSTAFVRITYWPRCGQPGGGPDSASPIASAWLKCLACLAGAGRHVARSTNLISAAPIPHSQGARPANA